MSHHEDNGHHDLMHSMQDYRESSRQDDYLRGVAKVAALAGPSQADLDTPVGKRVRALREEKGLSLADLAQRTGLSETALGEIEDEAASPPLGTLIKLGKALGMKLGTLIASGEDRPYTVVRAAERPAMSRFASQKGTAYGYSYEALAPQKKNRSMEPFLVTLNKADDQVEPSSHDGEEFIFVLDGRMEALVGDAREFLEPGDSIYYDSTEPHLLRPVGDEPARILAVIFSQGR
ncbi:MAG: cupin domain-containing protein [Desulfarculus sp.]|nr:cupin domain-containing protein [Desulfarculus sp.]